MVFCLPFTNSNRDQHNEIALNIFKQDWKYNAGQQAKEQEYDQGQGQTKR